jgi:hypothetical protein
MIDNVLITLATAIKIPDFKFKANTVTLSAVLMV